MRSVQYTLGPQDVDALAQLPSPIRQRAVRKSRRLLLVTAVVLVCLAGLMRLGGESAMPWALVVYAGFVALLAVLSERMALSNVRQQFRQMLDAGAFAYLLGENAVELRCDGLWHRGPIGESTLYWSAIESAGIHGNHVYIRYSALAAHIIPVSAFGGETFAQAFLVELHHLRLATASLPVEVAPAPVQTVAASPLVVTPSEPTGGNWWRQGERVVGEEDQKQRRG